MLTKWSFSNFKCFRGGTELELGRLTILAGPNNSGKSMLLRSILLVCQSINQDNDTYIYTPNGHLARLGRLLDTDLLTDSEYRAADRVEMKIGWEWSRRAPENTPEVVTYRESTAEHDNKRFLRRRSDERITYELSTGARIVRRGPMTILQPPGITELFLRAESGDGDGAEMRISNDLCGEEDFASPAHGDGHGQNEGRDNDVYRVVLDENSLSELDDEFIDGDLCGCSFKGLLPEKLEIKFDRAKQAASLVELSLMAASEPRLGRIYMRTRRHLDRNYDIRIPEAVVARLQERLEVALPELEKLAGSIHIDEWQRLMFSLDAKKRRSLGDAARQMLEDEEAWAAAIRDIEAGIGGGGDDDGDGGCDEHTGSMNGLAHVELPFRLRRAAADLSAFFSGSVKYLGPLRQSPRLYHDHPLPHGDDEIGIMGEYAVAVLSKKADESVTYLPPENFSCPEIKMTARPAKLMEAVSDWLEYFGMGRLLSAFNGGQPGFGFLLKIPGARRPLDPESVGVGVSQVLPILIMCLAAPEGTTMIIEQPELHLHPQAQSRLGDFFLSMSLLGKQCILETHSEHMLERINYRAAASYGRLQPLVKCYFVEACEGRGDVSDKMGKGKSIYGGSTVREVPLNNYQAIVRWPEGFYDEGQRREEMIVRIAREAWDYPNLVDAAGENN